jgi:hypothetical protein
MSYTVDIWTQTFPADEADAWDLRDELINEHREAWDPAEGFEPASPEMADLHKRLTARFPCICEDDNGPWSDGPLVNNFGQGRAILGISFSRVDEVLPFVIETATGMGLHVFDGQDEVIHRPAGYVPPPEPLVEPGRIAPRKWWQIWR